jgi:hypothetical protein
LITFSDDDEGWGLMRRPWDAGLSAGFARRLGKSAKELGVTKDEGNCPDGDPPRRASQMMSVRDIGLSAVRGVRLEQPEYKKDFRQRFLAIDGQDMWKLERRQDFRQPGTPSWEACARGEWDEALRLYEQRRDNLAKSEEERRERRIDFRRVRVVERPIIPYVQWELNAFRVRTEYGELIRIVGPEAIRELESEGSLPELINLGSQTLYEICYDERGIANGAVRYSDRELVARHRQLCRDLYEAGEDFRSFFDREVLHLPPPPAEGQEQDEKEHT